MAIDFPANPAQGDIHTDNGVEYQFDGAKWKLFSKQYFYNGTVLVNTNNQTEIDLSVGNFFDLTLSESTAVSFINPPVGAAQKFQIKFSLTSDFEQSETFWNLNTASYDNVSFSVSNEEGVPYGIDFRPDGTKMYIIGFSGRVHQYTLSTAWDVSTAAYDNASFPVGGQESNPQGVAFKPNGTQMYIIGYNTDTVYQYTLSTAWEVSAASYDNVSFSVSNEEVFPSGIDFRPDGTKMYILGFTSDSVHQYTLSTAWDVSTAAYDNASFPVGSQEGSPQGVAFKPDGTQMFMVGGNSDSVYSYTLSTAWDLSTASYDGVNFSVAVQDSSPYGIDFRPDGTQMYIMGGSNDRVYQYNTSLLIPTVTWPQTIVWESGSAPTVPELGETDLIEFYTSDGGTTYYAKLIEDNIS